MAKFWPIIIGFRLKLVKSFLQFTHQFRLKLCVYFFQTSEDFGNLSQSFRDHTSLGLRVQSSIVGGKIKATVSLGTKYEVNKSRGDFFTKK